MGNLVRKKTWNFFNCIHHFLLRLPEGYESVFSLQPILSEKLKRKVQKRGNSILYVTDMKQKTCTSLIT